MFFDDRQITTDAHKASPPWAQQMKSCMAQVVNKVTRQKTHAYDSHGRGEVNMPRNRLNKDRKERREATKEKEKGRKIGLAIGGFKGEREEGGELELV